MSQASQKRHAVFLRVLLVIVGLLAFGVSTNAAQSLGGKADWRMLDSPRPTLGYYHDYGRAADMDGARARPALPEFSSTDDSMPLSTASAADWFDRFSCFIGLGAR